MGMRQIRRVAGMIAAVFAFMGAQPIVNASADETIDCRSEMVTELQKLVSEDPTAMMEQFQLTALKLAHHLVKRKNKTFEEWVRKENARLTSKRKFSEFREKILEIYRENGEGDDRKAFLSKVSGGDYFKLPLRFTNSEVSAYLRTHSRVVPDSPFGEIDAAIVWVQSQLSRATTEAHGRGSKEANLTEITTVAAQYTGMMRGEKKYTLSELEEMIREKKAQVDRSLDALIAKFSARVRQKCLNCSVADCRLTPEERENLLAEVIRRTRISMLPGEAEEEKDRMKAVASSRAEEKLVLDSGPTDASTELPRAKGISASQAVDGTGIHSGMSEVASARKSAEPSSDDQLTAQTIAEPTAAIREIYQALASDFRSNPSNDSRNINRGRNGKPSRWAANLYREQAAPLNPIQIPLIPKPRMFSEEAFQRALIGYEKLHASNPGLKRGILTIIDLDQPSDARRLYVVDLNRKKVLLNTYTTHGGTRKDELAHTRLPAAFSSKGNSPYSAPGFYVSSPNAKGELQNRSLSLDYYGKSAQSRLPEKKVKLYSTTDLQVRLFFTTADPTSRDGSFGLPFYESGRFYGLEDRPMSDLVMDSVGKSVIYVHTTRD